MNEERNVKQKSVKISEMEQKALKSVIDLVERSGSIQLEELLENRVTQESTSLFNADGSYRKNMKSQILQTIDKKHVNLEGDYIAIIDMGMIWRLSIPKSEEKSPESDEPFKFKDYFKRVADMLVDRHPSASTIICVNDVYDHPHATKEDERIQRQKM